MLPKLLMREESSGAGVSAMRVDIGSSMLMFSTDIDRFISELVLAEGEAPVLLVMLAPALAL